MSQIIKEQYNEQINHIIDKNKKLLIFDMDGTLLDSMGFWQNLGRRYLESKGKAPENNLEKIIESMTLKESASYFKTKYSLEEDVETIIKQVLDFIEDKYLNEIPLKKGIYNIQHIIVIETNTAPNKYILLNIFISNIECLSDLHSNTCNNCDITKVHIVIVLQVAKSIP